MFRATQISIPTLVRIKDGALDRLGIYLARRGFSRPVVMISHGLVAPIKARIEASLSQGGTEPVDWCDISENALETAVRLFLDIPKSANVVIGAGGGKALDVAKYVAHLSGLPYLAVPTSLSNDGFCSPQSSLTVQGHRRSLPAALPRGVVVDTAVCREAPRILTLSGIGDLVAKFTAVRDWKLAFHATGEAVNDFAALLSDGSIHSFQSHPQFDAEGIRLLSMGLLLNGISMEVAGSSRPASGSEHLISHALDLISSRPRLHGLQVGLASYLISRVQRQNAETIAELFNTTCFWQAVADDPFSREEWLQAIRLAPTIKEGFHTVLSDVDRLEEAQRLLTEDPRLAACFSR